MDFTQILAIFSDAIGFILVAITGVVVIRTTVEFTYWGYVQVMAMFDPAGNFDSETRGDGGWGDPDGPWYRR